jgi:glycosyltransferase involved in cell wall biosynthesis
MITVVVPVYNGERTIQETLLSITKQAFKEIEILIINDGSQDTTLEIIKQVKDERIKVFTYPNRGLAASRNRGLANAKGEYVSFIDADDLWTPDKLESQYKALQENPQAALAYSWTDYIDKNGHILRSGLQVTANGNVYEKLLIRNFLENGSNALFKTDALRKIGGFDESLPCVEDWDLYLRLSANYNFVCVPIPQILYRVSTNSISKGQIPRRLRRKMRE